MTMQERIQKELERRIKDANFKAITITMKCNNDNVVITPCWYGEETPKDFSEVEYFLVDSGMVNLYGNDTLAEVANTIFRYKELLAETDNGIKDLKNHIRKYGDDSDWDFVSDWHKDLFGHRPHVGKAQIIAWAFSNSENSARYFTGR